MLAFFYNTSFQLYISLFPESSLFFVQLVPLFSDSTMMYSRLLLVLILLSCCTSSRHQLTDNGNDKITTVEPSSIEASKILFLLDDKEISKEDMDKIAPNTILSINVIKDKEKITQYTFKEYDGVIVIRTKKN